VQKTVYLSLGSNVGDREANLRTAIEHLRKQKLEVRAISPVYETDPVDVEGQPKFLNLAMEIQTELFPMQLLTIAQRIEQQMGRERRVEKGPRVIDIDIVLFGKFLIDSAKLTIPHPRMHVRRFVLEPMVDIAPELRHPAIKRTMRELRNAAPPQGVKKTAIRIE
jgi:2-amino-4-hydroxy-6-hydroxymethyldihydropteridine diphosphokinase